MRDVCAGKHKPHRARYISMLIHGIENDFSTKRRACHSTRTAFSSMRWNGPVSGTRGVEDISHKYIPVSLIPALMPRQGLSHCAFQTHIFTGSRIVEMLPRQSSRMALQAESADSKRIWYLSRKPQPLQAQSQRTTAPESRFDRLYFGGFSGGLVEVAYEQ